MLEREKKTEWKKVGKHGGIHISLCYSNNEGGMMRLGLRL
jgi:hypothetical protein